MTCAQSSVCGQQGGTEQHCLSVREESNSAGAKYNTWHRFEFSDVNIQRGERTAFLISFCNGAPNSSHRVLMMGNAMGYKSLQKTSSLSPLTCFTKMDIIPV